MDLDQVDRLISALERIAVALEKPNTTITYKHTPLSEDEKRKLREWLAHEGKVRRLATHG